MKAVIWTKYGPPEGLRVQEVPTPAPGEKDVLIRVHAAAASQADTEFRRIRLPFPFGLLIRLYLGVSKPTRIRILGTEFAGEVVSVGKEVTRYTPGDRVFGYTGLGMGTYAQYLCVSETASGLLGIMGRMPSNLTYEEAAVVPFGGLEALHGLRQANVQPGQKVLIVGAGGSIGTYAVQLAKHYGAEVTGVDKPGKLDMLRQIGADHVVDYTREDFTKRGQTYDVILDTIGKSPFARSLFILNEGGAYVNAKPWRRRQAARHDRKRILPWSAGYSEKNLSELKELIEAGVLRPVIDRRYPLEQIADAHRYVDSGNKKGNVVIVIDHQQ